MKNYDAIERIKMEGAYQPPDPELSSEAYDSHTAYPRKNNSEWIWGAAIALLALVFIADVIFGLVAKR